MKNAREIIIAPLFTEKTSMLKAEKNVYAFEVRMNANKIEIKQAIEKIFEVDVISVNTIKYKGKPRTITFKRRRAYGGYRSDWKKALVTVRNGQSIADFEI